MRVAGAGDALIETVVDSLPHELHRAGVPSRKEIYDRSAPVSVCTSVRVCLMFLDLPLNSNPFTLVAANQHFSVLSYAPSVPCHCVLFRFDVTIKEGRRAALVPANSGVIGQALGTISSALFLPTSTTGDSAGTGPVSEVYPRES